MPQSCKCKINLLKTCNRMQPVSKYSWSRPTAISLRHSVNKATDCKGSQTRQQHLSFTALLSSLIGCSIGPKPCGVVNNRFFQLKPDLKLTHSDLWQVPFSGFSLPRMITWSSFPTAADFCFVCSQQPPFLFTAMWLCWSKPHLSTALRKHSPQQRLDWRQTYSGFLSFITIFGITRNTAISMHVSGTQDFTVKSKNIHDDIVLSKSFRA